VFLGNTHFKLANGVRDELILLAYNGFLGKVILKEGSQYIINGK
jgi:hypothetical protein